jgi:hypothetical protein
MVRTIPQIVDPRPLVSQLSSHPAMQIHDLALRVVTMRDAGLIGDDEDEISALVEQANCGRDAGHPTDPLGRSDVLVIVVDHAVSIEKRGGPSGVSGIAGVQQSHHL